MTLHHSKHHQTYVTNLNNSLSAHASALTSNDIRKQLALQPAIKFNAGGHINHSLFWVNLAPASSNLSDSSTYAPKLTTAIKSTYGGVEEFKTQFKGLLLSIQGSGWGWLVVDEKSGALDILQTKDQDVVPAGKTPLLGVDMWEHAYYLQYLNGKAAYVDNIWLVMNWKTVEERFVEAGWWGVWQPLLARL
ncbi:Superoxide dismutase [Mn], mitochondrial [Lecanora helva]